MRCSDVIRTLDSTAESLPIEVERHLQSCTSCARVAQFQTKLNQAWKGTRPVVPSSFDALWSRVESQLASPQPVPVATRPAWIHPLVLAAQAAAVLIAITFAWKLAPRQPSPPAPPPTSPIIASNDHPLAIKDSYTVEAGQSLILRVDDGFVTEVVEDQVDCSDTVQIAAEFDLFNYLESL
jgi:hypothetical protein